MIAFESIGQRIIKQMILYVKATHFLDHSASDPEVDKALDSSLQHPCDNRLILHLLWFRDMHSWLFLTHCHKPYLRNTQNRSIHACKRNRRLTRHPFALVQLARRLPNTISSKSLELTPLCFQNAFKWITFQLTRGNIFKRTQKTSNWQYRFAPTI